MRAGRTATGAALHHGEFRTVLDGLAMGEHDNNQSNQAAEPR